MMSQLLPSIFIQGHIGIDLIASNIAAHETKTSLGASSLFLGQVRADGIEGKKVVAIEYTAYESMALQLMHKIREEMFAQYPIVCMHVWHSLGIVAVGHLSLFVSVSAAHRLGAIQACHAMVNRIKGELPIWGKEILENDSYYWKSNAP